MTKIKGGEVDLTGEDIPALSDAVLAKMKSVPQVKVVRRALGLSQEEFSERFHIPVGTLRDWEQGRKVPDQAARSYLRVIATDPVLVQFALGAFPKPVGEKKTSHFGAGRVWFVYRDSEDAALWRAVVVPRVATEEQADALARQFAEDEPGVRFGYGSWTPIQPQTAEKEYVKRADGHLEHRLIAAE